jgi:hypothetical protein
MAMKSLIRPGTGDHVWWMIPSAPSVLHRLCDDAQRDESRYLVELDLLALQFLVDAEQALDPAVDLDDVEPAPRRASP